MGDAVLVRGDKHADEAGTLIACRNGSLNIKTRELLPPSRICSI